ncbi:MAG: tRNA pseudouridine(38-40) synthase TruA [Pirellulaceae bacterium]|nr:tRNA pseudouridine(38-40) synthase TruA [Pirellulaceae bacterium]
MRFLRLTIAYEGTSYVGWQVQPNGVSIQLILESAWTAVTQETLRITASGRTDSGVHALQQVCSLCTHSQISASKLLQAINANLPFDIRVLSVVEAPENFHAIRDAVGKTYRYQIQTGRIQDLFQRNFRWFVPRGLDTDAMQEATRHILGKHDFSSFEAAGSAREDSIRTVRELTIKPWQTERFQFVDIEISADGFLYNMVRNIVGSLIVVGRGRQGSDWIKTVMDACDRKQAGETAPAHGLFLVHVQYDW